MVPTPPPADSRDASGLYHLSPSGQLRAGRLTRRFVQLLCGLTLYGVSLALIILSGLGMPPWDVFHYGLSLHLPVSIGTAAIGTSLAVLVAWLPLRQAPGIGTLANAVLIGLVLDQALRFLGAPETLTVKIAYLLAGVTLNGVATAAYIGSHFGPGPRDGLMTGLSRVSGRSIRLVRSSLEVIVVLLGWLLGGVVGVGTLVYALGIGPLAQFFLPRLSVRLDPGRRRGTG